MGASIGPPPGPGTPAFEKKLKRYMKLRGIKTKSEAFRLAVEERLKQIDDEKERGERVLKFLDWAKKTAAKAEREMPLTDNELWETNKPLGP